MSPFVAATQRRRTIVQSSYKSAFLAAALGALLVGIGAGAADAQPAVVQSAIGWASWTGASLAPRILASSTGGRAQLWDAQTHRALAIFENVFEALPSPDARFIVAHAPATNDIVVIGTADGGVVSHIAGGSLGQHALAFSPDDALVAIDRSVSGAGIIVASAATGRTVYTLPAAGGGAAFSPDGRILATLEPQRRAVLLWTAETGSFRQRLTGEAGVFGPPLFSPDGKFLVTVANAPRTPPHGDGSFHIDPTVLPQLEVDIWDLAAGRVVWRFPFWNEQSSVYDESPGFYAFADRGRLVASSRGGRAVIADLSTDRVRELAVGGYVVRSVSGIAILTASDWLTLAGMTTQPVLHFAATAELADMALSDGGVLALAVDAHIALLNLGSAASICNVVVRGATRDLRFGAPNELEVELNGSPYHIDPVGCTASPRTDDRASIAGVGSPDGSRVLRPAARAEPGRLELRDAQTQALLATIPDIITGGVLGPRFARNASVAVLATNHSPEALVVIDARTGQQLMTVAQGASALSPDGARLAVASDWQTTLYDTSSGRTTAVFAGGAERLQFTPNGRALIALRAGEVTIESLAGRAIATLTLVQTRDDDTAWIIALPSGDYAASPTGATFVDGGAANASAVQAALARVLR